MTLRTVVLTRAALALAAISVLAGCTGNTGGSTGATPSASASISAGAAMRAVAACLRTHGYPNAPDPVQDDSGNWSFPDAAAGAMPGRTTVTPCDDLARRAKSLNRGQDQDRVSAADLAKLRSYAACIRRHGVADWPDPSAKGDFVMPPRLEPPHGTELAQDASKACESVLGGVDVRIAHPGGHK